MKKGWGWCVVREERQTKDEGDQGWNAKDGRRWMADEGRVAKDGGVRFTPTRVGNV